MRGVEMNGRNSTSFGANGLNGLSFGRSHHQGAVNAVKGLNYRDFGQHNGGRGDLVQAPPTLLDDLQHHQQGPRRANKRFDGHQFDFLEDKNWNKKPRFGAELRGQEYHYSDRNSPNYTQNSHHNQYYTSNPNNYIDRGHHQISHPGFEQEDQSSPAHFQTSITKHHHQQTLKSYYRLTQNLKYSENQGNQEFESFNKNSYQEPRTPQNQQYKEHSGQKYTYQFDPRVKNIDFREHPLRGYELRSSKQSSFESPTGPSPEPRITMNTRTPPTPGYAYKRQSTNNSRVSRYVRGHQQLNNTSQELELHNLPPISSEYWRELYPLRSDLAYLSDSSGSQEHNLRLNPLDSENSHSRAK